ncbi:MAG: glycosyltransferase family 39 protein [Bacteroidales bacterium]|nr:glycosyltransferase family 39 protein [Bacteroidales bacterium]
MIPYFPKSISNRGVLLYAASLAAVSIAFMNYAMDFVWIVLGITEILLFFLLSSRLSVQWQRLSTRDFTKDIFVAGLLLRIVWVLFSYFFFQSKTGIPFEFGAADALSYHGEAEWLAGEPWSYLWHYLFASRSGVSDSGYSLYLTTIYKLFGPNIIVARLLKALYSAFTCVLLYRLAARSMGEQVGRMAGIFAMLMPNLIIYCGMHLKETEMLLLIMAFLERADYVLRAKRYTWWNIVMPLMLAGSLFLFRTVLGVVALFSFATAVMFSPDRVIRRGRKVVLAFWVVLAIVVLAGGTIQTEVEGYWENRDANRDSKRTQQTLRGNQWAKYATATVMAPMEFVMPFSTMVDTGQNNQIVLHAGNYVRNFMGGFVLIALVTVLFVKKNWREFSLLGSFVIGYLGVISLSGYANSERFLLPGLPCLIIMWAFGISSLNSKNYKFVNYWYVIVVAMEVAWAYFKIGSRGWL